VEDNEPSLGADAADVGMDTRNSEDWGSGGVGGNLPDLERTVADVPDLRSHLLQQLNLSVAETADRFIGIYLIDQLDESGYLRIDLTEAAVQLGAEHARVESVLALLRRFYLKHGYADIRIVSAVGEYDPGQKGFIVTYTIVGSLFLPFLAATLLWLHRRASWDERVPRNGWITTALLILVLVLFATIGAREILEAF